MKTRYPNVFAYSGNYANADSNFVIQNLNTSNESHDEYYATYCVLENIISRGTPTRPSNYLLEKYGEPNNEPCIFLANSKINWTNTIKGFNKTGNNPAKEFFDRLPSDACRSLFMPEVYFSDIFPEHSEYDVSLDSQRVDFYCEKERLVVEIDGAQHGEELQRIKDETRNRELNRFGIKVRRIKPSELSSGSNIFDKIGELSNKYTTDIPKITLTYTAIFRFQILILELLINNYISLNDSEWHFNISSIEDIDISVFEDAINDLFLWLNPLLSMRKIEHNTPNIFFDNSSNSINIDIGICSTWDDSNINSSDTIYVRNAYLQSKNYFRVSTDNPIEYKLETRNRRGNNKDLCFILKNIYGFDKFREGQEKIIINALTLNDTIGILPTGSGKSLCYQIACLLQPCVNLCIEPIKALMYDQEENLNRIAINRIKSITSDMNPEERSVTEKEFGNGELLWIFVSPERLQSTTFRESLSSLCTEQNLPIAYSVIDEAHCMSEWGHDFRTSYLNLTTTLKKYCPASTLLGLTATASRNTLRNLQIDFNMSDRSNVVTSSTYERKELSFNVHVTQSKETELNKILSSYIKNDSNYFEARGGNTNSTIIFTPTVNGKNDGISTLQDKISRTFGIKPKWYAGSSPKRYGDKRYSDEELAKQNKEVQKEFKENSFSILIATKAFGMGIDKPNIRNTIHYGIPSSLEALYQEAGRAGRDGKDALCSVIYNKENDALPEIKKATDKIFLKETSVEELKQISENSGRNGKDIYTQLFFIVNGLNTKDEEIDIVKKVLSYARPGYKKVVITASNADRIGNGTNSVVADFTSLEKVLYHLKLIGIVEDWTIDGMREKGTPISVDFADYSNSSITDSMFETIHAYEPEFSLSNDDVKYAKYFEIWNSNLPIEIKAYSVHWEWYYDNIVYSRRTALKNLVDQCISFDPKHPEIFKNNLESYFKVDNITDTLEDIFESGSDIDYWKIIINKDFLLKNNISSASMQLKRFLESTKNNVGFNFIDGILRILNNEVKTEEPLTEALKELNVNEWKEVCSFTADAVTDIASSEQIELISKAFIDASNEENAAEYVYLNFNDNYSLQLNLLRAMKKIKDAWEGI